MHFISSFILLFNFLHFVLDFLGIASFKAIVLINLAWFLSICFFFPPVHLTIYFFLNHQMLVDFAVMIVYSLFCFCSKDQQLKHIIFVFWTCLLSNSTCKSKCKFVLQLISVCICELNVCHLHNACYEVYRCCTTC